jgi:hypothetical protein
MPYNPGITNRSGELLAGGITKGADAWTEALAEVDRAKKETELMAPYVAQATKKIDPTTGKPLMDPSAVAEFSTGNQNKRRELGVTAQMALKDYFAEEALRNERTRIGLDVTRVGLEGQRVDLANREYRDSQAPLSPEDQATLKASRHAAIRLPGGRIQIVELPQEKFNKDDIIDLGNGYSAMPAKGMQFLPNAGTKEFHVTPEQVAEANAQGWGYVAGPHGDQKVKLPTPISSGGGSMTPDEKKFRLVADAIYAKEGRPTLPQLAMRQSELNDILAKDPRNKDTNGIGERITEELARINREITATGRKPLTLPRSMADEVGGRPVSASPRTAVPAVKPAAKPTKESSANKAALQVTDPIAAAIAEQEGAGGNDAAPVEVKSQAEWEALPAGAPFIGPDGKLRRK